MRKPLAMTLAVSVLLMATSVVAKTVEPRAGAEIGVQPEQVLWTGQQVTLNLDLKTTGFSFGNVRYSLPEVEGAFLMQTDTTTIKLSETVEGQAWQILRYPLALYPHTAGELEIPPIEVRFSTSAGFGSPTKEFEFKTGTLYLDVQAPPGTRPGDLVVTTPSFELDYAWQPAEAISSPGEALSLSVTRRARGMSAMLLPPLPVFRAEGLAAYPQPPDIEDRSTRGELTGERTDKIIWVVEQAGQYDIPGVRFQWWDPKGQELRQQVIPGMHVDILEAGAVAAGISDDTPAEGNPARYFPALGLAVALLACVALVRRRSGSDRRAPADETSAFKNLQKACSSNNPERVHAAVHAWLAVSGTHPRTLTLLGFARATGDSDLESEFLSLQEALVTPGIEWQAAPLLRSLRQVRRGLRKQGQARTRGPATALNPRIGG